MAEQVTRVGSERAGRGDDHWVQSRTSLGVKIKTGLPNHTMAGWFGMP